MELIDIFNDVLDDFSGYFPNESFSGDELFSYASKIYYSCGVHRYGLSEQYLYAFYMYLLFHDDESLNMKLLRSKERIISAIEPYRWLPDTLKEINKLSEDIFGYAKEYYNSGDIKCINSANEALTLIEFKSTEFGNIEYKYESKEAIMALYSYELQESIIDVAMMNLMNLNMHHSSVVSLRMREYIYNKGHGFTDSIVNFEEYKNSR